jgi:tetratricopeptide (TPR) repeat protein
MPSLFRGDGREARELFEEAYARFSNSPSIAFDLGNLDQATNDCRRADTLFSRALELRPGHEEARLGRTICRTYLSRNDEAIADATVLIDVEASNRGDAYYWRAWNRRRIGQLDAARADIDRARTLRYNARILTLAGMIEYDQRDFDTARTDLQRAREMDARECEAPWYLALVEYSVEAWAPSAQGFAGAADCYDMLVKDSERLKAEMAARTDVSEEFRATQLAGFDAAIKEDSVQRSAAELNAAINYGRAGRPVRVRLDEGGGGLLRIRVIDEGDGIAAEHIPRLTERFYRVDPSRSRAVGGTGLGLAIAKHIALRHQGRMEIRSRPGEGTAVRIYLPRADRP